MEKVTDFIFLDCKITADGDCSYEIKRCLLLGREAMANLDSKLTSRDITLLTKVHPDKALVFPIVVFGCESFHKESWALKTWSFWTVVLEKTLESPLDCKIKPVNPERNIHWNDWCWSWSSSTLATYCEELTHWKRPWCWKGLKTGGEGDNRGRDGWMASPTQWTWIWASSGSWWWTGKPGVLRSMGLQRVGNDLGTKLNCFH